MPPSEPLFPVGGSVRFRDDVQPGDYLFFDSTSEPGVLLICRLHQWEVRYHEGQMYRCHQEEPGRITLRLVR